MWSRIPGAGYQVREVSMTTRMETCLLGVALAALIGVSACSGVLMEKKYADGSETRLKLDQGEGWETYDDKPRIIGGKKNPMDEMSVILKREMTF
jgi:hypothetical protein